MNVKCLALCLAYSKLHSINVSNYSHCYKGCLLRDTDKLAQLLKRQPGWGGRGSHIIWEKGKVTSSQAAVTGKGYGPSTGKSDLKSQLCKNCVTLGK